MQIAFKRPDLFGKLSTNTIGGSPMKQTVKIAQQKLGEKLHSEKAKSPSG